MTLAATADARSRRGRFYPLTVTRVDRLCADAVAVTLVPDPADGDLFSFRPGQSLTIRRSVGGRDERRSYSICSAAGLPLRIGVREVAGGAVSGWLVHGIGPGDVVEAQPPSGNFTPDLAADGRHVLIAAGSGITPILSIAASLLQRPETRLSLLYGNRSSDTVMFADDVADLKDRRPAQVQLVHVLSREAQEVDLFSGRMDAAKLRALLPRVCAVAEVDHWWLCGPFGMITDAVEVLSEFGVAPQRIHRELFYVEDLPPAVHEHRDESPRDASTVTVIMDGRSSTTAVAAGQALLDAAQRVRPDLPFACKGGVCGTCRALVRSGEVRMRRNFALEPDELAAGFVLSCQSLAVSEEVVLDYDA